MAKITKMKDRVEAVMGLYPETRENDKVLIWRIWEQDFLDLRGDLRPYNITMIPLSLDILKELSSPETIRRARQLVQAEGKYLPPADIQRKRLKQEAAVRREVREKKSNYYSKSIEGLF